MTPGDTRIAFWACSDNPSFFTARFDHIHDATHQAWLCPSPSGRRITKS